jgi:hypothetical protein
MYIENQDYHYYRQRYSDSRYMEIERKLLYKFYNEYYGVWHTAPREYRKSLNKRQRSADKRVLRKIKMCGDYVYLFNGNYKNRNWYW